MSWMRWPVYAWGDGHNLHLWARDGEEAEKQGVRGIEDWCLDEGWAGGLSMSMKLWDELVLFRMAELVRDPKRLRRTIKRIRKEGHGNVGTWDLFEMLGEDPQAAFAEMMLKARADRPVPDPSEGE